MKIFVVGARGFPDVPGGIEKACKELYSRLAGHRNMEITAIVISKYYKRKIKEWAGIRYIYIKSLDSKNLEKLYYGLIATIISIFKRPDIVHFQATNCTIYIPILKLFRIKTVVTYRSFDFTYPKWSNFAKFIIKLSDLAAFKADKIIAISRDIADYAAEYTDRVVIIPNGIAINTQKVSESMVDQILGKYSLSKDSYIFFAGRFTEEKALEDLIEAYKRLERKELKLVIAGDAYQETDYSRMIKKMAVETDGIIMTGFITGIELQVLFSNARLFVLPSRHEGLPHVLLEGLGYGVQVLASDIKANTQFELGAESYFRQGDIEDLKSKILYHLHNKIDEAERLSRFRMLEEKYNWDKIASATVDVYKDILSGHY
jgi:hypothetical protein